MTIHDPQLLKVGLTLIGLAAWTLLVFWIGWKAGKHYEAGFYMSRDRVCDD